MDDKKTKSQFERISTANRSSKKSNCHNVDERGERLPMSEEGVRKLAFEVLLPAVQQFAELSYSKQRAIQKFLANYEIGSMNRKQFLTQLRSKPKWFFDNIVVFCPGIPVKAASDLDHGEDTDRLRTEDDHYYNTIDWLTLAGCKMLGSELMESIIQIKLKKGRTVD